MKKAIIWILLLLLAGGGFYWFRGREPESGTGPSYDTAVVERRNLKVTVESTGEVEPRNRLSVKPPIAGRLEELLVDEGETVEKGQILGWVSSTERATLLDAALATSQEELEYWQDQYKPTPLICPIKGTIIARDFEPGQTISASDAVVVIADDLIIVANLDETDIGLIAAGQTVTVTLEAYPDKSFACEVEKIAYDAEIVSNVTMYEVDVRPLRMPSFARSGMTADIEFVIEEKANALTLPASAIQQKTGDAPAGGDRPDFSSMSEAERKAAITARMRERGLSDAEIQQRLAAFAGGGQGMRSGGGGSRPGGGASGGGRKPSEAPASFVLTGLPGNPESVTVETGVTDGSYTEIVNGLEEGDEVLIPKVKLSSSSGKSGGNSLIMGGPGSGGPRR
jgi:macrolide-specific efflux system membrane fusion protein